MGNKPNSGLEEESWRQNMLRKSLGDDDSVHGLLPTESKFPSQNFEFTGINLVFSPSQNKHWAEVHKNCVICGNLQDVR